MMSKRIDALDLAKGIGIILVIIGHCIPIKSVPCQIIFTFHMPLFFLISGYFFRTEEKFPTLIKKKSKSLLWPFVRYFSLGLAVTLIVPAWRSGLSWAGIKKDLILADPNAVHNSSIWFLVALFFVFILAWVLLKTPLWLNLPVIAALYFFGMWYASNKFRVFGYARLPFNLDVVPVAILFFVTGFYMKKAGILQILTRSFIYETLSFIVFSVITGIAYINNGYVNLHGLKFGNPFWFVTGGLAGTFAILSLCCLISRLRGFASILKKLLLWYGRRSLRILGVQSLLIRLYVLLANTENGSGLKLYAFPWDHAIFSSIIVTFVLCPAICIVMDVFDKIIKQKKEKLFHEKNSSS